jgi:2,3-bisphosphoglycerate-dependent phosphoglycerate mutase
MRHGESEADLLDVHEGRADFKLTDRGERQAAAAAEWLTARHNITKIYASPLKRAYKTAKILNERAKAQLVVEDDLMEFNNGLLAGMKRDAAAKKYPHIPDMPLHESAYEQESLLEFRYRADSMLSKILAENPEDAVIAVVSHGGMINQLYRSFLRLPVDSDIAFITGDVGIHHWRIEKGVRRVIICQPHLPRKRYLINRKETRGLL